MEEDEEEEMGFFRFSKVDYPLFEKNNNNAALF